MVAGGGVALVRVAAKLAGLTAQNEDQNVGIKVALRAMEAPLRQIVSNAGEGFICGSKQGESGRR